MTMRRMDLQDSCELLFGCGFSFVLFLFLSKTKKNSVILNLSQMMVTHIRQSG